MTNLLRKCENCVFSVETPDMDIYNCIPKLPPWLIFKADSVYLPITSNYVYNSTAESCNAFRLRETGVNE